MRRLVALLLLLLVGCGSGGHATIKQRSNDVPPEFRAACGVPGYLVVVVTKLPVTIRHADCDLSDATISYKDATVQVPNPGTGLTQAGEGPAGGASLSVVVADNGDVTITP